MESRYTPVNPSFTISKWGLREYKFHGHVFLMLTTNVTYKPFYEWSRNHEKADQKININVTMHNIKFMGLVETHCERKHTAALLTKSM